MLRLGDTLVPLLFMSNRTNLSNFARHQTEWLIYIIIGNMCWNIRQLHSTHTVVMVTTLPIPIQNHNVHQKWLDQQQETHRKVLNKVLQQVNPPLTFKRKANAKSGNCNVLCANGIIRCCTPVLAVWLADCPV
jgi:hypothetical protein